MEHEVNGHRRHHGDEEQEHAAGMNRERQGGHTEYERARSPHGQRCRGGVEDDPFDRPFQPQGNREGIQGHGHRCRFRAVEEKGREAEGVAD
jgi:hypothetical protein